MANDNKHQTKPYKLCGLQVIVGKHLCDDSPPGDVIKRIAISLTDEQRQDIFNYQQRNKAPWQEAVRMTVSGDSITRQGYDK